MINFMPASSYDYTGSGYGYIGGSSESGYGYAGKTSESGYGYAGKTNAPEQDGRIQKPEDLEKNKETKGRMGIKDPAEECQTCKNRKYKDGSDEMVSFKTPTHISPESAAAAVRAHEQEHVTNAYSDAATKNGKVISASVSIHTAICPECGRTYISGGTTHTQIKYFNEDNPYQKGLKSADRAKYSGMNLDYAV